MQDARSVQPPGHENQEEERKQAQECEAASSSSNEGRRQHDGREMMHLMPSYPFPADMHLEFQGARIEAIRHLCQLHPGGTRAVAVFFPGVHGGVGPCRQPGSNFDEMALFATVCQRLVDHRKAAVDCYRCSWPFMRPRLQYAVGGGCRILHHALLEAMRGYVPTDGPRLIKVIFIGHSLGGAVSIQSAETVARHFGVDGAGGQYIEGLEKALVRVSGVCTLNGAVEVPAEAADPFASLQACRALLVCGDADEVVPPAATSSLFEALPMRDKRNLILPGGTHDLYGHKMQLVEEVLHFILQCVGEGE